MPEEASCEAKARASLAPNGDVEITVGQSYFVLSPRQARDVTDDLIAALAALSEAVGMRPRL